MRRWAALAGGAREAASPAPPATPRRVPVSPVRYSMLNNPPPRCCPMICDIEPLEKAIENPSWPWPARREVSPAQAGRSDEFREVAGTTQHKEIPVKGVRGHVFCKQKGSTARQSPVAAPDKVRAGPRGGGGEASQCFSA